MLCLYKEVRVGYSSASQELLGIQCVARPHYEGTLEDIGAWTQLGSSGLPPHSISGLEHQNINMKYNLQSNRLGISLAETHFEDKSVPAVSHCLADTSATHDSTIQPMIKMPASSEEALKSFVSTSIYFHNSQANIS